MIKKYRPYFNLAELKHIATLLHADNQISDLTRYVSRYVEDIDRGWRQANILTGQTISQKLGFVDAPPKPVDDAEQSRRFIANEMSEEESRAWMIKNNTDPDTWMPIDPTKKGL